MEVIRENKAENENIELLLSYPFDSAKLLRKRKSIKRKLTESGKSFTEKKIAVLAGSTADDIVNMIELFLLKNGIKPTFYISEYDKYWEDAMFCPQELYDFAPDIVFFHTTYRNLIPYMPNPSDSREKVDEKLKIAFEHFSAADDSVFEKLKCPVIQNNFEYPPARLYGNRDFTDIHGAVNFVNRINSLFAQKALKTENFHIHDINYLSSCYGLDKWCDEAFWCMYKYAMEAPAFPSYAHSVASVIKSIFGKNKKVLALDLDNTLWGGIVGDDGPENLELGEETPNGQAYREFQRYVKSLKDIGVLLTVCSKNDRENALAGLNHPDSLLKPDDFQIIKANWDPKHLNIAQTAKELNVLTDSVVFADDNPAERMIVSQSLPASVPDMDGVENYIRTLDRNAYFEVTSLSEDDLRRNEMYKENALREAEKQSFTDYSEYLRSLKMQGEILPFCETYMQRIAQLTNKSNQFNLTTKRYTAAEIQAVAQDENYIALYGKLIDKFGDNGVVSVVIGHIIGQELHMDLWLMSCRVLKRDMEYAMLDEVVARASKKGIKKIVGYYYPTAKNSMVKHLYQDFGFSLVSETESGSVLELCIEGYKNQNKYIAVNGEKQNG